MCDECREFYRKIEQGRRFLAQAVDALTAGRLETAIEEFHRQIAEKHPGELYEPRIVA